MRVGGLWRYPVKSLKGEQLETAELTSNGIAGDRLVHVRGWQGPVTGRSRHGLLTIAGTTGLDGVPRVDGHPWHTEQAVEIIRAVVGDDSELVPFDGPARFDILNLLVATEGAVQHFGHDLRRLRPNILISGTGGLDEQKLVGRALRIGEVVIGMYARRARCVVTTIDPDTGEQDPGVFRRIHTEFGGKLALDSWVITPGLIHENDEVELIDTNAEPEHLGGWIVGAPYEPTG